MSESGLVGDAKRSSMSITDCLGICRREMVQLQSTEEGRLSESTQQRWYYSRLKKEIEGEWPLEY